MTASLGAEIDFFKSGQKAWKTKSGAIVFTSKDVRRSSAEVERAGVMGLANPALQMRTSMWVRLVVAARAWRIFSGEMADEKSSSIIWRVLFSPFVTLSICDLRLVAVSRFRTEAMVVVLRRSSNLLVSPRPRPLFAPVTTYTWFTVDAMVKGRAVDAFRDMEILFYSSWY